MKNDICYEEILCPICHSSCLTLTVLDHPLRVHINCDKCASSFEVLNVSPGEIVLHELVALWIEALRGW